MTSHDQKDAPHTTPHDAPPDAPATPAAPPIVEYPKMLYHPDGRQITVPNKAEEAKAAKDGFTDTPGAPAKPVAPEAPHGKR
jgi:hypothetical protein